MKFFSRTLLITTTLLLAILLLFILGCKTFSEREGDLKNEIIETDTFYLKPDTLITYKEFANQKPVKKVKRTPLLEKMCPELKYGENRVLFTPVKTSDLKDEIAYYFVELHKIMDVSMTHPPNDTNTFIFGYKTRSLGAWGAIPPTKKFALEGEFTIDTGQYEITTGIFLENEKNKDTLNFHMYRCVYGITMDTTICIPNY